MSERKTNGVKKQKELVMGGTCKQDDVLRCSMCIIYLATIRKEVIEREDRQ